MSTSDGQISPKNFKQNKSYASLSESTPCFLMLQKHVTLYKHVIMSNIEKLLLKTLDSASKPCFLCPPVVSTQILSLFVQQFYGLTDAF